MAEETCRAEGDTAWVLASSAMVLLMTPGIAFFYGGLVRDTNIINTMMMSIIAMGVVSILWALLGFSLAYGHGGPFIGNLDYAALRGLDETLWEDTTVWSLAFAVYQMTFAIMPAAIMSGSLVERVRFIAYIILIALWSICVYVPLCHWVWGHGGWMDAWGAKDFAGGTVVHISGGTSGLVAAMLLGPRGRAKEEDRPHNVPFVLLGAALLWFGWSGFNGGSALAADSVAARAVASTYLSASSSMLTWTTIESVFLGHPSSIGAMVGVVAGLVVITPAAGYVAPLGAIVIGACGAMVCYMAIQGLNRIECVDDTLDAFGIHGVGGFTGAVLTGVFAIDGGLAYGGGFELLGKQTVCALVGGAYSALVTAVLFGGLKISMRIRLHAHQESCVDQHVHGEAAFTPQKAYDETSPAHPKHVAQPGEDNGEDQAQEEASEARAIGGDDIEDSASTPAGGRSP